MFWPGRQLCVCGPVKTSTEMHVALLTLKVWGPDLVYGVSLSMLISVGSSTAVGRPSRTVTEIVCMGTAQRTSPVYMYKCQLQVMVACPRDFCHDTSPSVTIHHQRTIHLVQNMRALGCQVVRLCAMWVPSVQPRDLGLNIWSSRPT